MLYMAHSRRTVHEAALASADTAIRTGCQAAAVEVLNWSQHTGRTAKADRHTVAAGALSQAQLACGAAIRVKQPNAAEWLTWSQGSAGKAGAECQVAPADSPGKAQHTGGECAGADQQTHLKLLSDAQTADNSQHCGTAIMHQACRNWQQETQHPLAMLDQQHELEAYVHAQLLQVCFQPPNATLLPVSAVLVST